MKKPISIFLHRRDFRTYDNAALGELVAQNAGNDIMHIFIFSPRQIDPGLNKYFNKNCVEFMVQCLHDLNKELKDDLHCFHGEDLEVLNKLVTLLNVQCIAFNLDYTPFARKRDATLVEWCLNKGINCIVQEDYTLFPLESIVSEQGKVYEMFKPFYDKCVNKFQDIPHCKDTPKYKTYRNKHLPCLIKNIDKFYFNEPNHKLAVFGGRTNALEIVQKKVTSGALANYGKLRDFPALDKTTKLSAYIKFGCVSMREVFFAFKKRYGLHHELVRQLLWREFYAHLSHSYPWVLKGQVAESENRPFKKQLDVQHVWDMTYDEKRWEAFGTGKTGFPFVDAGIRQLLTTGWCHNRSRMIIAAFGAKDLHISPWIVEKWFASNLLDYDPCSNSGGVQWAYGIGADPMFMFRSFNPFLQGYKFDKDCKYIKQWLPELRKVANTDIHTWHSSYVNYEHVPYPKPVVEHTQQVEKIKRLFQRFRLG